MYVNRNCGCEKEGNVDESHHFSKATQSLKRVLRLPKIKVNKSRAGHSPVLWPCLHISSMFVRHSSAHRTTPWTGSRRRTSSQEGSVRIDGHDLRDIDLKDRWTRHGDSRLVDTVQVGLLLEALFEALTQSG